MNLANWRDLEDVADTEDVHRKHIALLPVVANRKDGTHTDWLTILLIGFIAVGVLTLIIANGGC